MGERWRLRLVLAGLGLAILVAGDLSIRSAPAGTHVAAWWPAAGIAVAVALRLKRRGFAAALLVTWLASVTANLTGGRDVVVALLFSTANTTEVAVVCLLVSVWNPVRCLDQLRELLLTGLAVLVGASTAGLVAAITVTSQLGGDFWSTAQAATASHASAVLLFLPFGLRDARRIRGALAGEALTVGLVLVVATLIVFSPGQHLPLVFLLFPFLVISGFRYPLCANAVHLIAVSTTATFACSAGWGPLITAVQTAGLPAETTGTILQAFMASAAVMVYALRVTVDSRQAALSEAKNARSHLEAVLESAPSTSIIQTDLDGVIQVFNQGAVNMLGYAEATVVGICTPALFHDPAEVAARAAELGVEPGFEVFVHEVRSDQSQSERRDWTYITSDGTRKRVSLVVSRVDDNAGQPIGFLGIAEDVGAQRQVERLLVQSLDHERRLATELRAADQLKDDFVSSVSHELRTPMTSVLGYAELLRDEYSGVLDHAGTDIIGRIEANGRRLLGLVDDLLTLSRIESGALTLAHEPVDLVAILHNATSVLEPIAAGKGVTLTVQARAQSIVAEGDERELERVIINLLSNALKFTPPGGTVTVTASHDGHPVITVQDTGAGIPTTDLDRVFDRFHRAANAQATGTPGTGLGLAIVKAILDRHHATITVGSEIGTGTTFTITLPTPTHRTATTR